MKKVLFALLIAFSLTACNASKMTSNMKSLELGMTKNQVVAIMGDNYKTEGASQTNGGNFETLRYTELWSNDEYALLFQNGKLVEWQKEVRVIAVDQIGNKVKNLKLDMTRQEVISLLGPEFKIAGATKTREGNFETIRYYDTVTQDWYSLTLKNDRLVEWVKEQPSRR